jgi:hypothetical protein
MKASLSEEQRQAVHQSGSLPLEVADQQTKQVFYLISAEQYHQVRPILEGVEEIDLSLYEIENVELTDAS